jgi:hypothetical protein
MKIKKFKKYCWIAKQSKKGWRLGFELGEQKPSYLKMWFADTDAIAKVLSANTVFIHKGTK